MQRGAAPPFSSPADAPVPFRACLSTYKTTQPGSKQYSRTPQVYSQPRNARSACPPSMIHTSPTQLCFARLYSPFALQQRHALPPHPLELRRLPAPFFPSLPPTPTFSSLPTS